VSAPNDKEHEVVVEVQHFPYPSGPVQVTFNGVVREATVLPGSTAQRSLISFMSMAGDVGTVSVTIKPKACLDPCSSAVGIEYTLEDADAPKLVGSPPSGMAAQDTRLPLITLANFPTTSSELTVMLVPSDGEGTAIPCPVGAVDMVNVTQVRFQCAHFDEKIARLRL